MTRIVISQPMYFPWAGFLAQMSLADVFVWLDDAQFSKGSFTNRIQIKQKNGIKWMTVPIVNPKINRLISELEAPSDTWKRSHYSMLKNSLGKSKYFDDVIDIFNAATSEKKLSDIFINSAQKMTDYMGISPNKFIRSSQLNISGCGSERVMNIVKYFKGSEYITGHGASNYLDCRSFAEHEIIVSFMQYDFIAWPQSFGDFTPYVTGLDLLATKGRLSAKSLFPKTMPASEYLQGDENT